MFKVYYNAWKVDELRKKILFTLLIIAIARLGASIPLPGMDAAQLAIQRADAQSANLLYQVIMGGQNSQFSIFSMGIGPYITSSIIMQLLTAAIPALEEMQKEGEEGRKKISKFSRYLTVVLALLQGIGLVYTFREAYSPEAQNMLFYATSVLSLIAGTTFVMWLAEAITKSGVGNGSSMIIFINIISGLPSAYAFLKGMVTDPENVALAWGKLIGMLIIFLFLIVFAIVIQAGERRIPVQYSKKMVGRKQVGGQASSIPIKVNTAGVISIIFAVSLLQFPQMVGQFIPGALTGDGFFPKFIKYLDIAHPVGAIIYIILIFVFTFFYTSMVMNPQEMAENMKKQGGFIPGIRPGAPTTKYITTVLNRITVIGGISYALIAFIPILVQWIFKLESLGFGGTTVLIVVGVALDTVKALESQLLMRHYKSFLN